MGGFLLHLGSAKIGLCVVPLSLHWLAPTAVPPLQSLPQEVRTQVQGLQVDPATSSHTDVRPTINVDSFETVC